MSEASLKPLAGQSSALQPHPSTCSRKHLSVRSPLWTWSSACRVLLWGPRLFDCRNGPNPGCGSSGLSLGSESTSSQPFQLALLLGWPWSLVLYASQLACHGAQPLGKEGPHWHGLLVPSPKAMAHRHARPLFHHCPHGQALDCGCLPYPSPGTLLPLGLCNSQGVPSPRGSATCQSPFSLRQESLARVTSATMYKATAAAAALLPV